MKETVNIILTKIKDMNLPKEILLSLDFKDLIENLNKGEKDIYELITLIIAKCTDLDTKDCSYLWLTHKSNNYKELMEATEYKNDFNFQMAQYFDKSIY